MSDQYTPIPWSDAMLTGEAGIDEQHQILLNLLNSAAEQLNTSSSRLQLEEIVRDLMSYALYHFDTEEELMLAHAYPHPERNRHLQEHRNFSTTVARLHQDIVQGTLVTRDELLRFLHDWLLNHILKSDKQLGDFLANLDSSQA